MGYNTLPNIPNNRPSGPTFKDSPGFWGETWNIGVVPHSAESLAMAPGRLKDIQWLFADTPTDYFSDPCLVSDGTRMILFFERFNRSSGLGTICAGTLSQANGQWRLENQQTALEAPYHLSHPFVFGHQGKWYLIPEAADSGHILIHEALDFPFRWKPGKVLLPGVRGLDPVVFSHDGLLWLMFTDAAGAHNANLQAFYADSVFGPWKPHSANPIVTGLGVSRPAGVPSLYSGKFLRPAQDSRFTYGQSLVFREIQELSPTRFREITHTSMSSLPDSPYPHGLHSLSGAGGLCVIDGKSFTGLKKILGPGMVYLKQARQWWRGRYA